MKAKLFRCINHQKPCEHRALSDAPQAACSCGGWFEEVATHMTTEIQELINAMKLPAAQQDTLECFVADGWEIEGNGANGSVDICRQIFDKFEYGYIRADGVFRTR